MNINIKIFAFYEIILLIPSSFIKFILFSSIVTLFISISGFGFFKVIGFNRLPKPAHKIKAVFIFTILVN